MGIRSSFGSMQINASRFRLGLLAAAAIAACGETLAGSGTSPAQLQAAQRTIARFTLLAGSPQNARALVHGLHTGSVIILASPSQRVSFIPATPAMGYGNVSKALTLAQHELASRGVENPTPEELQVVLMGGALLARKHAGARIVHTPGVLPLRGVRMGWGQIAHALAISPTSRASAPVRLARSS